MKPLLWPAAFTASTAFVTVFAFAWPDIRPTVVAALKVVLWTVAISLSIAVVVFVSLATAWRVKNVKTDIRLSEMAVQHAAEISGDVRISTNVENLWIKGYLDLGWLGWILGSLSLNRTRPYFESGAERYWTWMTGEMKKAGYARIETAKTRGGRPYKTTVFVGSYKAYFRRLMHGEVELLPHPKLPPPVISTNSRQNKMTEITEIMR